MDRLMRWGIMPARVAGTQNLGKISILSKSWMLEINSIMTYNLYKGDQPAKLHLVYIACNSITIYMIFLLGAEQ